MLPKKQRLSKKDRLLKPSCNFFLYYKLLVCKNNLSYPRFAIVVSKKVNKKAVIRNRIKRQVYSLIENIIQTKNSENKNYVLVLKKEILKLNNTDLKTYLQTSILS